MIFLALLLALILEQFHPVRPNNKAQLLVVKWMTWVEHLFFAGAASHAHLVWFLAVVLPALIAFFIHTLFGWFNPNILTLAWSVFVLHFSLGFRQFSAPFNLIKTALEEGDDQKSRTLLAVWLGTEEKDWSRDAVLQHVMDYSVWALHIHVLGVVCAYAISAGLGFGPAGAVLYRLAELFFRRQDAVAKREPNLIYEVAYKAWIKINWLPTRFTLILFSIVGSFEDVITAWRRKTLPPRTDKQLILDSAAAALNIRYVIRNNNQEKYPDTPAQNLGAEAYAGRLDNVTVENAPEKSNHKHTYAAPSRSDTQPSLTTETTHYSSGLPLQVGHLKSLAGLAWRTLAVAMLMLLIIQITQLIAFTKAMVFQHWW